MGKVIKIILASIIGTFIFSINGYSQKDNGLSLRFIALENKIKRNNSEGDRFTFGWELMYTRRFYHFELGVPFRFGEINYLESNTLRPVNFYSSGVNVTYKAEYPLGRFPVYPYMSSGLELIYKNESFVNSKFDYQLFLIGGIGVRLMPNVYFKVQTESNLYTKLKNQFWKHSLGFTVFFW